MRKNVYEMNKENFDAIKSSHSRVMLEGQPVIRVVKDKQIEEVDEPTYAKLKDVLFSEGIIEVKVLSKLLDDAPDHARGFIGVAFRISEDDQAFEGMYIRPTNGRVMIQQRRNSSTQYFSYPDYKYDRLRKEAAGQYESYADMGLNEWIDMKVVVQGATAQLFLNQSVHPVLVVNDLKHGEHHLGAVGLWVDVGTEGFFKDLVITHTSE